MNQKEEMREIANRFKGVWFCTCKDSNHTTGCTRTSNRRIDDLIDALYKAGYRKIPSEEELDQFFKDQELVTIYGELEKYKILARAIRTLMEGEPKWKNVTHGYKCGCQECEGENP
jgi:hypothetical protein